MRGNSLWLARVRAGRSLKTIGLVLLVLVPAECDRSSEPQIDRLALTRAAASLALTVGEVVERYAANLPAADDWVMDLNRVNSIFRDEANALHLEAVGASFAAAASASRKAGNSKGQTARQLVIGAWLASEAFQRPLPDYRPGDQTALAAVASSLEARLDAALTSTYDFETGGHRLPASLNSILADSVSYVLLIAGYNYVGPDGSHPIRDRMRALGSQDPPPEFVDPAGNVRLPHGSEPDELIARFEDWRIPAEDWKHNYLWQVVDSSANHRTLWMTFEPAVDKAFN
jgi:hypothetical protein